MNVEAFASLLRHRGPPSDRGVRYSGATASGARQCWACRQFSKNPDKVARNAQGRLGVGATTHCNHGPGTWLREYLDWQPFAYFTCRTLAPLVGRFVGPRPEIETAEFLPNGEHRTRIVIRIRLTDRGRLSLLTFRAQRRLYSRLWERANATLLNLVEEDTTAHRYTATPA